MTARCCSDLDDLVPAAVASVPPAVATARQWAGLALLALPTVLLGLDLTLLHLALPALAADLGATGTQALWIMDAYGFMIAGFLVTMGTLGDRIGRRKLLLIGAAAFGVASVVAAFSTGPTMLILARAALGVAGATLMPSTLALISNMFADQRQRALAIGIWATMFALGMAAGPVVGGLLVDRFWWGAAFLVALPIVGLLLLLAPFLLPEYRAPQSGRPDLASVGLSLCAMLPMIYGIKEIAKHGPTVTAALAVALGVAAAVPFVRRQRRLASPLVDLDLFASRTFTAALVVLLVGLVAVGGTILLVTQYLQLVAGFSPLEAGYWMGPPALAMVAAGVGAPLVARRIRPGDVVAAALALSAVGYALLARLDPGGADVPTVMAGFALAYLGLGTIAALGTDLVVGAAPPENAGAASALSETVQELGAALGIAALGSLSTAVYRRLMQDRIPESLGEEVRLAVGDSLWAATALADRLPAGLLAEAQAAFVAGVGAATMTSAVCIAALAGLACLALRPVAPSSAALDG